MVNQKVLIKDKYRTTKKVIKILIIVFVILLILVIAFAAGFIFKKSERVEIILENPLKNLVFANTNEAGEINEQAVIEQAIIEFNQDYINYLLVALGTGYLHKSPLFENPFIEFVLGDEIWSSEINKGLPNSIKQPIDNEDLRITISKEEAVRALLSPDIEQFMKNSVRNGNIQIEMIASKVELFSKGYLDMYSALTGEDVDVE